MDISQLFLAIGILLCGFMCAMYLSFTIPILQWSGIDKVSWPIALVLLAIAAMATPVPFIPKAKRAIAESPHKMSFAVGYFFVALYAGGGLLTLLLLPFRIASGI